MSRLEIPMPGCVPYVMSISSLHGRSPTCVGSSIWSTTIPALTVTLNHSPLFESFQIYSSASPWPG